jgi:hypothetical protein
LEVVEMAVRCRMEELEDWFGWSWCPSILDGVSPIYLGRNVQRYWRCPFLQVYLVPCLS